MRVTEIIDYAVVQANRARKGEIPNDLWEHCLDTLNIYYEQVWNLFPWNNAKMLNVVATTSTGELILPPYIDNVRAVRIGLTPLSPMGEILVNRHDPEAFEDTGSPCRFVWDAQYPVATQPTVATVIKIKSSSTADTTVKVRVYGTVGGVDTYEDFTLNGTSTVTGTKSFTAIRKISKGLTVGRVTVMETGLTELGTIAPWDYAPQYLRLQLIPRPDSEVTVTCHCLRKFVRLIDEYDGIEPDEMSTPVMHLLLASLFRGDGEMERAAYEERLAEAAIKAVSANENDHNDTDFSVLPERGSFGDLGHSGGVMHGYPHGITW